MTFLLFWHCYESVVTCLLAHLRALRVYANVGGGSVDDCAADVAWWCPYIQPTDCYEASATCCLTCRKYRKPVPGKNNNDNNRSWVSLLNSLAAKELNRWIRQSVKNNNNTQTKTYSHTHRDTHKQALYRSATAIKTGSRLMKADVGCKE